VRKLRLPLELGLASLQDVSLGFLLLPFGLAVSAVGGFIIYEIGGADDSGYSAIPFVFGLGMVIWSVTKLRRGWLYRPSDIVFDDEGLRIEGGTSTKLFLPWKEVEKLHVRVDSITEKGDVIDDTRHVLKIGDRVIAEADDDIEAESFREIVRAVEGWTKPNEPVKNEHASNMLSCSSCGAPLAPRDEEIATCAHCGAKTDVPQEVRDRVRAATKLEQHSKKAERLVAKLLDQPGAKSTTALLWISFALVAGAWPVTVWTGIHLYLLDEIRPLAIVGAGVLPFVLIADGFFLSRLRLVDRRALGELTLTFGASPPIADGEPLRCRACLAPLPRTTGVLVQCVYCSASNVTGIDPRANAARAKRSSASLADAMKARLSERGKWRWRTLASLPLFLLAPLVLRSAFAASTTAHATDALGVYGSHLSPSLDGKELLYRGADGWFVLDLATRKSTPAKGVPLDATTATFSTNGFYWASKDAVHDTSDATSRPVPGAERLSRSLSGAIVASDETGSTYVPLFALDHSQQPRWPIVDATANLYDDRIVGIADRKVATSVPDKPGKVTTIRAIEAASPSFSPDGARIVFIRTKPERELCVMSKTGGSLAVVVSSCDECTEAVWAPDKYVYFVRDGAIVRVAP
jgi:uncharacterized Zn finger protein (UPF0148 family)